VHEEDRRQIRERQRCTLSARGACAGPGELGPAPATSSHSAAPPMAAAAMHVSPPLVLLVLMLAIAFSQTMINPTSASMSSQYYSLKASYCIDGIFAYRDDSL
jgi:hypothetical protein